MPPVCYWEGLGALKNSWLIPIITVLLARILMPLVHWRVGRGVSGSPIIKRNLYSPAIYIHTHHPGSQSYTQLHSLLSSVSHCLTFTRRNPKLSLQTQVVSHLVTLQIRYKSRFPCFLYSHAIEAQHLCCVCGKGRLRPAVSLPWQDGLIVIPGSIVRTV